MQIRFLRWGHAVGLDASALELVLYDDESYVQFFRVLVDGPTLMDLKASELSEIRFVRSLLDMSRVHIRNAVASGAVPLLDKREAFDLDVGLGLAKSDADRFAESPLVEGEIFDLD